MYTIVPEREGNYYPRERAQVVESLPEVKIKQSWDISRNHPVNGQRSWVLGYYAIT